VSRPPLRSCTEWLFGKLGQRGRQPRDKRRTAGGERGAVLGDMSLDRADPYRVGLVLAREQAVALAQRGFEARGVARVAGVERHSQPVHVAPPLSGRGGEQPVHRRGQPAEREPFAERHGRGVRAVNLNHAAVRPLGLGAGAEHDRLAAVPPIECGADRETAGPALPGHLGEGRAAQPAPRCKQRQRLEHVGLARSVLAEQQVELCRSVEPRGGMVAEVGEGDPVERHGPVGG
jgi:hypothetical protein